MNENRIDENLSSSFENQSFTENQSVNFSGIETSIIHENQKSTNSSKYEIYDKLCMKSSDKLYYLVKNDEFMDGEISRSEEYVNSLKKQDTDFMKSVLIKTINRSMRENDYYSLAGLLHILSYVDYIFVKDYIENIFHLMIIRINDFDNFVLEKFIQVFEYWNISEFKSYLERISTKSTWIENYRNIVYKGIKNG